MLSFLSVGIPGLFRIFILESGLKLVIVLVIGVVDQLHLGNLTILNRPTLPSVKPAPPCLCGARLWAWWSPMRWWLCVVSGEWWVLLYVRSTGCWHCGAGGRQLASSLTVSSVDSVWPACHTAPKLTNSKYTDSQLILNISKLGDFYLILTPSLYLILCVFLSFLSHFLPLCEY